LGHWHGTGLVDDHDVEIEFGFSSVVHEIGRGSRRAANEEGRRNEGRRKERNKM
jgi:hypothetical protein